MSRLFCNVYRGGRVEFTTDQETALRDTLPAFVSRTGLAPAQLADFRKTIEGFCRLARDGSGERFIPGMPEAAGESENAELDALFRFEDLLVPILAKRGLVDPSRRAARAARRKVPA